MVLSIGSLLGERDGLRSGLGTEEGGEEVNMIWCLAQGLNKKPGGTGGLADVVKEEVALRVAWKAGEGEDGTVGQVAGADAPVSATGVSRIGNELKPSDEGLSLVALIRATRCAEEVRLLVDLP